MATYLLTWNPKRWEWDDLPEAIETVKAQGSLELRWSCGNTKKIRPGDRAFLIRLGVDPRGIMGAGTIITHPYEDQHWSTERRQRGEKGNFVKVSLDTLLDEPIISRQQLNQDLFAEMHWDSQSSGTTIPEAIARSLEEEWSRLTSPAVQMIPEEVLDGNKYVEGATRQILINAFERDRRARQACIDHYGLSCTVCGFNFEERYGDAGAGLIHVHHLKPLSEIDGEYAVDPIADLRPVCPNCHAIIHRRIPPYSMDEMMNMLR